ncbi:VOC family protein [Mycobacterium asiaticum]|uniref:Glyoxalase n=1 Tax=Mycobacterium asiaticum TaxID=1790 RepID=A0A1A3NPA3_MYCAS|nr:VOC family protein [Mycobacterium asiaticum]OBK23180.1 glyoxalase [Mycobacterium asiaticum]
MSKRDPLSVLHADDLPVHPDPAFAARLRRRLEAVLALPPQTLRRIDMSTQAVAEPDTNVIPRSAAQPYLAVADARAAIDWYTEAFGAAVVGEPIVMEDGRIGHAELEIAAGVLYLADEFPELGLKAPLPEAVSVSLMLHVTNTDAALRRARAQGATVTRDIYEAHGSRNATIIDPFGHRWMLSGPLGAPVEGIRHGDIGFISLATPDPERAAAFYGHVLGWTYDAASRRVTNTELPTGIHVTEDRPTLFCCYAVDDIEAARAAIAEAGGTADEAQQTPHGTTVDATDVHGMAFAVFDAAAASKRPELNGSGPGELAYVTYEVPNSAAFRDFYGRVLRWTFEPGRVKDGWQVREAHPMSGAAGGSSQATTVPMWTVANIDAAVARVREAGGTVLAEPSRQPYGLSAECTDDQGARFYLGQF